MQTTQRAHILLFCQVSEQDGGQEEQPHVQGAVAAWAQEDREELLHVRGKGQKPGGPHARGEVAKRSYPTSKARGSGREDQPQVQGAMAARAQEGLEELSHIESQEGQW